MACIVKSARLQGIFDVIKSLIQNDTVNSVEDIHKFFETNFPSVGRGEIISALVAPDMIDRAGVKGGIKKVINEKRKIQNQVDKLNELTQGIVNLPRNKPPDLSILAEIKEVVKDIRSIAWRDYDMTPEELGDIMSKIENLGIFTDRSFSMEGELREEAIQRALSVMRSLKEHHAIKRMDKRISELNEQIDKLSQDEIDFSDLEEVPVDFQFMDVSDAIAERQVELARKKNEVENRLRKIRREKRAQKGVLGFTGNTAVNIRRGFEWTKEEAWEALRSLKFMADISAWGVQAAPLVYSMMIDVNTKALLKGDFGNAFSSQRALAQVFHQATLKIIHEAFIKDILAKRTGKVFSKTSGITARKVYNQITSDPLYPLVKLARLKLSEARNLTASEEVFTSNVLNRFWVFGGIKDFSEDTMVSTLNMLRFIKFRQFYNMYNGAISVEELQKGAEMINIMTGTTNDAGEFTRAAGYIMSAPKLFLSRLKLGITEPIKFAGNTVKIGVRTVKGQKAFETVADEFRWKEMAKFMTGYVGVTALTAMLLGLDFEDEPEEKDFLRYTTPNGIKIDATGGIGTIYRTLAKAFYIGFGPPDDASYTTKKRYDTWRKARKIGPKDVLTEGFVQYKMHPGTNAAYSSFFGVDFFDRRFSMLSRLTGDNKYSPHIEGIIRSALPISIETAFDQAVEIYNGDMNFAEAATISGLQALGMNTYKSFDKKSDPAVVDYFNKIEYEPRLSYPDILKGKKDNDNLVYYKDKYKKMWNDAIGNYVIEMGADERSLTKAQFKDKSSVIRDKVDKKFKEKYGDEIKELK